MRQAVEAIDLLAWSALGSAEGDVLDLSNLGGGQAHDAASTGIKALMAAVLDNGITAYLSDVPRMRAEAEYWIQARSRRSPFSFAVVCETLQLDADAVRVAVRRLRGATAPRTAPVRRRPNVRREGRLLSRKTG